MARTVHKEWSFDAPEEWQDRTLVTFSAPAAEGKLAPNIVMTRQKNASGESLRTYASRQLIELGRQFKEFELERSGECTLADRTALEYAFRWKGPDGPLFQRIVMVENQGSVLHFAATCAAEDEEQVRVLFDQIFASVRFPKTPDFAIAEEPPLARPPAAVAPPPVVAVAPAPPVHALGERPRPADPQRVAAFVSDRRAPPPGAPTVAPAIAPAVPPPEPAPQPVRQAAFVSSGPPAPPPKRS